MVWIAATSVLRAFPLALCIRTWFRQPMVPFGWGVLLSSVGAMLLLDQPGLSQVYFAISAAPVLGAVSGALLASFLASGPMPSTNLSRSGTIGVLLALGAALGLAATRFLPPSAPAALALLAALLFGFAYIVAASGAQQGPPKGARSTRAAAWALAVVLFGAIIPATALPGLWSAATTTVGSSTVAADDPAAARGLPWESVESLRWLRDASSPDDQVATQRHCLQGSQPGCDVRRFYVAAYSERQVIVEGWAYTPRANSEYSRGSLSTDVTRGPFWDAPRLADVDQFVRDPDEDLAAALRDRGVDWVVVDKTDPDGAPFAPTLEPYAVLRHEGPSLAIYELVEP